MASFNKVILIGHLAADPELKQTQGGTSVCSFSIGVNRRFAKEGEQNVDFINIVAWRQTAEFVTRYFKKGQPILVCGQIQTRTWTDNQNNKRYATEVIADEVSFVAPRESSGEAKNEPSAYVPTAYGAPSFTPSTNFEEIPNDGALPF